MSNVGRVWYFRRMILAKFLSQLCMRYVSKHLLKVRGWNREVCMSVSM